MNKDIIRYIIHMESANNLLLLHQLQRQQQQQQQSPLTWSASLASQSGFGISTTQDHFNPDHNTLKEINEYSTYMNDEILQDHHSSLKTSLLHDIDANYDDARGSLSFSNESGARKVLQVGLRSQEDMNHDCLPDFKSYLMKNEGQHHSSFRLRTSFSSSNNLQAAASANNKGQQQLPEAREYLYAKAVGDGVAYGGGYSNYFSRALFPIISNNSGGNMDYLSSSSSSSSSLGSYSGCSLGLNLAMDFKSFMNCSRSAQSLSLVTTDHHNKQESSDNQSSSCSKVMMKKTSSSSSSSGLRNNEATERKPPCEAAAAAANKKPRLRTSHNNNNSSCSQLKVRKEKLGDRIAALHRLVAPFGKTDTASVLTEALGYIQFLQHQIQTLSVPYLKLSHCKPHKRIQARSSGSIMEDAEKVVVEEEEEEEDLKSRGLCLVPLSFTSQISCGKGTIW